MFFAGKAYIKKKNPPQPVPVPIRKSDDKIVGERLEEIKEQPLEESMPRVKRQKSIERLSISSLNHSLNSNSDSDPGPDSGSDDEIESFGCKANINDFLRISPPPPKEKVANPTPISKKYEMIVDTNVVSLDLSSLKEAAVMATGDPIFCSNCSGAFSLYSRITELSETSQLWTCEFCGTGNSICIEPEEIPRGQIMDYMLMSSSQMIKENKSGGEKKGGITVIFCIDISGSMCVTEPINGNIKLKHKKKFDLGGFSDFNMDEQYLQGENAVTYVSRLECVQAAIESQLQSMAKTTSNRKIGLIAFNSDISIYGDGTSDPAILTGDKLNSFETCFEAGISLQSKLKSSIKDTYENLTEKITNLSESGPTALGPALISAIGLASEGLSGSRVIICTDGLANVGIGRLDDDPNIAEEFYLRAANIAKDKGIEVSVISIEGEECKLSKLSKVCEITGGEVTRVNMMNIATEFANILETPIIATQVSVIIKIHRGLCFRYQDEYLVDNNTLKRELGNVTDGSEFAFEYSIRSTEELAHLNIDLDTVKQFPFQSQIHFTNNEGMRCMRVITALQDTTDDLNRAGGASLKVLGVNAAQGCAHLANKGEYRESEAVMRSWKRMMKRM